MGSRYFWNFLVALVAAVALESAIMTGGGIFAEAAMCGSSPCPFGPVYLAFEHTNCSGDVVYSSQSAYGLMLGAPCTSADFGGGRYSARFISYDTHFVMTYYSSNNCSIAGNVSLTEQKGYYGVCFTTTRMVDGVLTKAGAMYLSGDDDPIPEPLAAPVIPSSMPQFYSVSTGCGDFSDCRWQSQPVLYWIVTNINLNACANPHSAYGYANITAGTCYHSPSQDTFIRISCTSRSGYRFETFSANAIGCDEQYKVIVSEYQSYCETSNQQIFCNAPPTSPSPSSTPSSPPTLAPTPSSTPSTCTCTCPPTSDSPAPTGQATSLAPIGLFASIMALLAPIMHF